MIRTDLLRKHAVVGTTGLPHSKQPQRKQQQLVSFPTSLSLEYGKISYSTGRRGRDACACLVAVFLCSYCVCSSRSAGCCCAGGTAQHELAEGLVKSHSFSWPRLLSELSQDADKIIKLCRCVAHSGSFVAIRDVAWYGGFLCRLQCFAPCVWR